MHHPAMTPPLLTADLPGVGGQVRVRDEDFEVEEVPSYEPSGSGDHLYLWIEKRGLAPEFFARTIAQRLGTHPGNIGTAGLKDRHAITRQWVSVPKECESNVFRNSTAAAFACSSPAATRTNSSRAICAATASAS